MARKRITSGQIAATSIGSALGAAAAGTQGLTNTVARTAKYIAIDEHLELNPANSRDELTFTIPQIRDLLKDIEWDYELVEKQQVGSTDRASDEAFRKQMARAKSQLSENEYSVFEDLVVLARTVKSIDDVRNPITYKVLDRFHQKKQVCSGNHRVLAFVIRGFDLIPGTLEEVSDEAEKLRREFIDNATHKELSGAQQLLAVKRLMEASGESTDEYSVRRLAFNYGIRNKTNAHRIKTILSEPRSDYFWQLVEAKQLSLADAAENCHLSDDELQALTGTEEPDKPQDHRPQSAAKATGRQTPMFKVNGAKKDFPVQRALLDTLARGLGMRGEQWVKEQARERYGYDGFEDKHQVQIGINLIIEYLSNNLSDND